MNSSFLYHAWGLYHHKCHERNTKEYNHLSISKANEDRKVVPNAVMPIW